MWYELPKEHKGRVYSLFKHGGNFQHSMTVDIFCPIRMTGLAKLVFHEFLHVDRIHAIGGHPVVSYAVVALVAVLGKSRQG